MNKKKGDELKEKDLIMDENKEVSQSTEQIPVTNNEENTEKNSEKNNIYKDEELNKLKQELDECKENLLRVQAEADNFRKRLMKDYEERFKFANQSLLLEFLTVVDNIELALRHIDEGKTDSLEKFKEGLTLILKQMKDFLAKYGMKEILCVEGEQFDPNLHDAIMLDSREDLENNTITMVLQKGYTLNDRVVRPVKVRVNKI